MVSTWFPHLPSQEFDCLPKVFWSSLIGIWWFTIGFLIFSHRNLMAYHSFSNLPSKEFDGFYVVSSSSLIGIWWFTIGFLIFSHRNLMAYHSFSNLPSKEFDGFYVVSSSSLIGIWWFTIGFLIGISWFTSHFRIFPHRNPMVYHRFAYLFS